MPKVIDFPQRDDPHVAGEAICLCCKHEWIATAPVGTHQLDCPECDTSKGVFKYPVEPRSEYIWQCDCGSNLFFVTPDFFQCYCCGDIQEFE